MSAQHINDETFQRLQQRAALAGCSVNELLLHFLDDTPSPAKPSDIPYQLLVEHTTDAISLFDLDLRYLYANPIIGELTGIDPTMMIGKTDHELGMPEDKVNFWKSEWQTVIQTCQEKIIIFDFTTPQGVRFYESRLTPILGDDGAVQFLAAITRDITERKRTEDMLRDITNRLPGMILSYRLMPDGQDEVTFVSEGINAIYEISVEEAYADIGKVWMKVYPDDLEKFGESIRESAKNLTLWDYQWRIRMNDGSTKWVEGRGIPRRLEDGSTLWNTLLLDITDRKTLVQQQEELIDQLQLAIGTGQLGIWSLDLKSGRVDWNAQIHEIYGIAPEDHTHTIDTFIARVHPEDLASAQMRMEEASTAGRVFGVNFRIIRPNGEVRYLSASASAQFDDTGHLTKLMGIDIDVTDIRQGELKLQQTNEMMQSIIEHIPVLIALFDENGRFRFVNRHWIDQLGWTVDEIEREADPLTLFYPDPDYRQQVLDYMLSAKPGWRDFQTYAKDGQILETSWANVHLSDGGSIGIGQNITERKQAEQVGLEKERLLASLEIEKEHSATVHHIVAKIVHDLKTPLSVIELSREILITYFDRIDETQRRERLETIGKQIQYMSDLLNDLALIKGSVLEARSLQLAPTNLTVMCQITLQALQESIGVRHKLTFINDQMMDLILVDDVLINRILLNLLSNAIKYSQADTEITVSLRFTKAWILLQVSDQGMGIAPEHLLHIFDLFYRINTVKEIEGTGLGLSIVKDCVERHNGRISVESTLGYGTTFKIELPLIVAAVQAVLG